MEKPVTNLPTIPEMIRQIDRFNVINPIIAVLFCITGPLAILLSAASLGGLSQEETISWIFGGYFFGGVISIILSYLYRQPIGAAWTIPGAIVVGQGLTHLSFAEVIGAYWITGILIAILGFTGLIKKIMAYIPMSIIMGMVAGVFLPLGLEVIQSFSLIPFIATVAVASFIILSLTEKWTWMVPPILGATIFGFIATMLLGEFSITTSAQQIIAVPRWYTPEFTLSAALELVIPLAITVIGIQNTQGIAVLKKEGYEPPINTFTVSSGLGSIVMGSLGSVSACITGPVNAILNSSGHKETRYVGGIVFGILLLSFGLFAPIAVVYAMALPIAFVSLLGGLAMYRVLQNSFISAFSDRFPLGALTTFLVTIADVRIWNIGSAFWGIVFGMMVSFLLERKDLRLLKNETRAEKRDGVAQGAHSNR